MRSKRLFEELGLKFEADIVWAKEYQGMLIQTKPLFYAVEPRSERMQSRSIVFGDEGLAYQMMDVEPVFSR